MTLTLHHVDQDIFTVANLYSPEECRRLIQRAEALEFAPASVRTHHGQRMMPKLRNNDRVNLNDPALAQQMWARVQDLLPKIDGCEPTGVDDRVRFYRYEPGQQFRRHRDGRVTNDQGQVSRLSYLVYLNDNFEGGETLFRDYDGQGDERKKIQHTVQPITGSALLFIHHRWHEGRPILTGTKYVLRSDVFYE